MDNLARIFDYAHALSSVFALTASVVMQLLICRRFPKGGMLRSVVLGYFMGLFVLLSFDVAAALIHETLTSANRIGEILTGFLTYCALSYGYFSFLGLGETARRVRIVRELYEVGEKGLTGSQLRERYYASMMIKARLDRLVRNGQAVYKNGRYYVGKPSVLLMAKFIQFLRTLLFRDTYQL